MDITLFDHREMIIFNKLKNNTDRIRRRSKVLLDELSQFDPADSFVGKDAFALTVHEVVDGNNVLADYRSVLGVGRFVLTWSRNDDEIVGLLSFQREVMDTYGVTQWITAFKLTVPPQNSPYTQSREGIFTIPLDNKFGDHLSNAVFSLHLSILGALSQS